MLRRLWEWFKNWLVEDGDACQNPFPQRTLELTPEEAGRLYQDMSEVGIIAPDSVNLEFDSDTGCLSATMPIADILDHYREELLASSGIPLSIWNTEATPEQRDFYQNFCMQHSRSLNSVAISNSGCISLGYTAYIEDHGDGTYQMHPGLRSPVTRHSSIPLSRPKACNNCAHYYGQTHGGNKLICGMHPYGPDTDTCSDHESV